MKLVIKHIMIIDPEHEVANKFKFGKLSNIFLSDDNEVGKSSLLKSIYYTLGGNVKSFTAGWDFQNYIFQIECDIDGQSVIIQRFNKVFLTKSAGDIYSFANEKDFSIWVQDKMGMNLKLQTKSSDKYHTARMNAVLAPFYIDQDQSWASFYRDSFENLTMYKDQPKAIFEYYLKLSSNQLIALGEQLKALSNEKNEVDGQLRQVEGVRKSYSSEAETDVMSPKEFDELRTELNEYVAITDDLQTKISSYSNQISKIKMKLDNHRHDYAEIHKLLLATNARFRDIEYECTYCHSRLTREQSLTRLELGDNDFEIRQREIEAKQDIEVDQANLDSLLSTLTSLRSDFDEKNRRVSSLRNASNIDKYVDHQVITKLGQLAGKYQVKSSQLEASIGEIKKDQREERATLKAARESNELNYEQIKSDIAIELGVPSVSNKPFLNFQKVKDAGTALNKILLCLYLTYFEIMVSRSNTTFPMAMDSFVKNEITDSNEDKMFMAVQKHFMSLNNQTFFSLIKRNQSKLDLTNSRVTIIKRPILIDSAYKQLVSELIVAEDNPDGNVGNER